jgi:hypothetical protein
VFKLFLYKIQIVFVTYPDQFSKINSEIFTEVLIYKLILHIPIYRLPSIVKMTGNK